MRATAPLIAVALALAACSSSPASPVDAGDAAAATTTSVQVDDAPGTTDGAAADATESPAGGLPTSGGTATVTPLEHPLLAELTLSLDDALTPVVRLVGPGGTTDVPVGDDPATDHTILLAGMRADTTYTVEIDLADDSGATVGRLDDATVTTGSLPDGLPPVALTEHDPARMSPGLTFFDLLDLRDEFADSGIGGDTAGLDPQRPRGWLIAVDHDGEVVWYHSAQYTIGDARMLDDGTILYEMNDTVARRIDLRGNVLDEWASDLITGRLKLDAEGRQVAADDAVVVATDSMHHEQLVLPDGNHATLSTELRVIDGFAEPQCGEDPATFDGEYHLIGDVVVIYDPATGAVVDEFTMFDYLDPLTDPDAFYVCGLPFDFVFPNWLYRDVDDRRLDWTHANAIDVDEPNNALIVSVRHLDALIALRWKDDADGRAGELLWTSGPIGDLELLSGDWHHHQHAPEVQDDGTILVYDNGNRRPGFGGPDAPLYSRAVLYDIDPEAGTAAQLWEYRSTHEGALLFSPFVGDADRLANGNVLVTDGGVNGTVGDLTLSAQIVEVVPAGPAGGDVVFRLEVDGGPGWVVYRAERIASIYG